MTQTTTRRLALRLFAGGATIVAMSNALAARAGGRTIAATVYKDPSCGCCGAWAEHLTSNGFRVAVDPRSDMDTIKDELGVPQTLRSCHTAKIDGYVIEGHVPAADIKRLLDQKPQAIGLAVPGMPMGSPGMESGGAREPYEVVLFSKTSTSVFARH